MAPASVVDTERLETTLPEVTTKDVALPETPASGERPTVPAEAADPFEEELPFSD